MPSGTYIRTKENREKISKSKLGCISGNKGKKASPETIEKLRLINLGKTVPPEVRKKISESHKGKKFSKEHRIKIGIANSGENSYRWKGGITENNHKIRGSVEYKLWREEIFLRDDYTCKKTGVRGGKLHPHHILNFSQYTEIRFDVNNGITLSEQAHKDFHNMYGRINNTREQLEEFLK